MEVDLLLRWVCSLNLLGHSCIPGLCGAWFHLTGLVLGFVMKLGTHFALLPALDGYLSSHCVAWGWGLGNMGNVRLSLLHSSVHLFLFLCLTKKLYSLTWNP